jgi:hypothetical protein
MQSHERQQFYLGRRVRHEDEPLQEAALFYAARDLTTHGICVGMTGCGKTGLGIVLIEEAALSGIPIIVLDPKGDITNLALLFPDLEPSDFRPWLDVEGARRRGLSLNEYADQVAEQWQLGLARWDLDRSRIARLKDRIDLTIYTPGSSAGRPVSIMQSLHAPVGGWHHDVESHREMIASTVSAILALVDIQSDPISGREHILLSTIIEHAWRQDRDLDLAQLILEVQNPPFDRLGVLPLEVSFPQSQRMSLALSLNGLLASPRFAMWREGDSLSIDRLLRVTDGRSRVSVFSLAHLDDQERLFFVTLLLAQLRSWLRVQPGTPDLRAMLYFDELYGFMPPHPANPPTKTLLLGLLKQARSQGVGLVLATQNPIDLDYKGLSNAGTWFVGKLQTANDRERVLEGLLGASLEAGMALDRSALDAQIAGLESRVFLLHNVHRAGTQLFETRHTMSYLRGPLTHAQIKQIGQQRPGNVAEPASAPTPIRPAAAPDLAPADEDGGLAQGLAETPPVLVGDVAQFFVPVQVPIEWAIRSAEAEGDVIIYEEKCLVYRAALYGQAEVRLDSAKYGVRKRLTVSRLVPFSTDDPFVDWRGQGVSPQVKELDGHPAQDGYFAPLPPSLGDARQLKAHQRDFEEWIYRDISLKLAHHTEVDLVARPDEPASQFKRRCYQAIAERRDAELAKIEKRYRPKIERLEARIRREERELEQDEEEYDARKREELISAGESVLNLLSGRRHSRMLSSASRKRRLTRQSKADVDESIDALDDLDSQLETLVAELEREQADVRARWSEAADDLETVEIRPRKSDIFVMAWGVAWMPYWDIVFTDRGRRRQLSLDAFEAAPIEST